MLARVFPIGVLLITLSSCQNVVPPSLEASVTTLYVATTGNDTNPGTPSLVGGGKT
jgi:hypothetical protein